MSGAHVPTLADFEALVARVAKLERRANAASGDAWLSGADQAAAHLGWTREMVYKRVRGLPHYRVGARLMFKLSELDAWVAEHRG